MLMLPAGRRFFQAFALLAVLATGLLAPSARAGMTVSAMPIPMPEPAVCTSTELQQRVPCPDSVLFFTEIKPPLINAYYVSDFATMDRLYQEWCTGKARFPDGRWYLGFYGDALYDTFTSWGNWDATLAKLRLWQQSRPESQAALYAEAIFWRAYAWSARGSGWAHEVSREGWELFREREANARKILERIGDSKFQCAAMYPLLISVMIDQSAPDAEIEKVYQRGIRRFPEYHNIYFAMARAYSPRWGGDEAAYERFASDAAERTRSFEGMGMYARIFWLEDERNGVPFHNVPGHPPYWSKLKAGFDDLEQRYPSSLHNIVKYADVACRSGDSALYLRLRKIIQGKEDLAVHMQDPIDVCDRRHGWKPTGPAAP